MNFSKLTILTITATTLVLTTGCSSNNSDPGKNTPNNEVHTIKDITKSESKYSEHPLVNAFFELTSDLRLPVDDLYSIIRSFDSDNSFIEDEQTSKIGGNQYYKTFSTKKNDVKLTVKHTFEQSEEQTNNYTADTVQLSFINENISLNFNIFPDQVGYTVEKTYKTGDEQLSINTELLNNTKIEENYFTLVKLLSSKETVTLQEAEEKTKLKFTKNSFDYTPDEEVFSTYSYYDEFNQITLELDGEKITSAVCSSSILGEDYNLEKEVYFTYNTLTPNNNREITTTILFFSLNDILDAASKLF